MKPMTATCLRLSVGLRIVISPFLACKSFELPSLTLPAPSFPDFPGTEIASQPPQCPLAATKHFRKRRERPEQPERDEEQGDHQDPGKAHLLLPPQLMQHEPGEHPDRDYQGRDPADIIGEPEELERLAERVEDSSQNAQYAQGRTADPRC